MKALIVEDEEEKRRDIVSVLQAVDGAMIVIEARSLSSGLQALSSHTFDLIVLDMTMPTFDITASEDGGRPQAFGGRELLRHIRRRDVRSAVVVVTQFDRFGDEGVAQTLSELNEELNAEHPGHYRGAVYYSAGSAEWKQRLIALASVVRDERLGDQ
jgi:CheY-like chemotaxis protein